MEQTVTISKKAYDDAIEAMEHCEKVFRSMSDRGAYPRELCPFKLGPFVPGEDINKEEAVFLGKQGFMFLIEAIKGLKGNWSVNCQKEWEYEEKTILRNTMRYVNNIKDKLQKFQFAEALEYSTGAYVLLQKLATAVKMNEVDEEGEGEGS